MPVPASYNDLVQDIDLRDHVGYVWYQRDLHLPLWLDRWCSCACALVRWPITASSTSMVKKLVVIKAVSYPLRSMLLTIAADEQHLLTVAVDNRLRP